MFLNRNYYKLGEELHTVIRLNLFYLSVIEIVFFNRW